MIDLSVFWAWLLTDAVATYGVWHYRRRLSVPLPPAQETPRVALLVAIKGVSDTTPRFLEVLCHQQYPAYRVVFTLESTSDPALGLIEDTRERLAGSRSVEIVIAGLATKRAQKVHNLLAALGTLEDEDRIVVFADADILPSETWLSQLIRPVAIGEVPASSGYRWQLPTDTHWPSLIVAAADLSVATAARSARWNLGWAGSLAIDRATLNQIDLPKVWERAASDDLTLTAALRVRGLKINAPLHVLVPSPVAYDWGDLFQFARRQYLLLRTYAPRHWFLAGWTLCLPALAAMIALREAFEWWVWGFTLTSLVLLQLRLSLRRQIAELVLPSAAIGTASATIAFARWAWPLIHTIHLGAFLASAFGQRFTWAGIDYRLHGRAVSVEQRAGNSKSCKRQIND
jgi:hypothetical protein